MLLPGQFYKQILRNKNLPIPTYILPAVVFQENA